MLFPLKLNEFIYDLQPPLSKIIPFNKFFLEFISLLTTQTLNFLFLVLLSLEWFSRRKACPRSLERRRMHGCHLFIICYKILSLAIVRQIRRINFKFLHCFSWNRCNHFNFNIALSSLYGRPKVITCSFMFFLFNRSWRLS